MSRLLLSSFPVGAGSRVYELFFSNESGDAQHKKCEGLEFCRISNGNCFDKIPEEILLKEGISKMVTSMIYPRSLSKWSVAYTGLKISTN